VSRVLIMSSDCHLGPSPPRHMPYLESEHHERLDEVVSRFAASADKGRAPMERTRPKRGSERGQRSAVGSSRKVRTAGPASSSWDVAWT
jgi:hypothetical protein